MKALPYLLILAIAGLFISFIQPNNTSKMNQKADDLVLTILYDNYNHNSELKSDWGFSCLIEGMDKTILFDSGTNGKILLENMK